MLDLIVTGGTILTLDPSSPQVEALGVLDGRVLATGARSDVERLAGPGTRRMDLAGQVCIPGLIDAHIHFISLGLTLDYLDLKPPRVRSMDAILNLIRRRASRLRPGEWIIGRGYDHNQLRERRHPALGELDAAAPEHPVALVHISGHCTVVNSRALLAAGAARAGQGVQSRPALLGASAEGDGLEHLLEEKAQALVAPYVYRRSLDVAIAALDGASRLLASLGVTMIHDAGVGRISDEEIAAYQLARERGLLRQRISLMVRLDVLRNDARPWALGLRTGFGNDVLKIGPAKIVLDGSLLGRTAALEDPYPGTEGRGELLLPEADFRRSVADLHRRGWQCAIHAIGDRAVSVALEAIEEAQARFPRLDARHRIEHCGLVTPGLILRLKAAGVIPVPQPHFVAGLGDGYLEVLGEGRTRYCYVLRSFLKGGLPVPGSSDAPVAAPDPLLGIHSALVRRTLSGRPFHPEEAISAEEALRMYTRHAAYSSFDEGALGVLRRGAHADFVVLSESPLRVEPDAIPEIEVLATYMAGRPVFERSASDVRRIP